MCRYALRDDQWDKIKNRALATRYDKRKINFLGGIYLAAIVILLN